MIQEKQIALETFEFQQGDVLQQVPVTWQQVGCAPRSDNVVLFLHGISASHQALVPSTGVAYNDAGWGQGLIGPACAVDTDHFCVLIPNTLGSCFGTLGPRSAATGEGALYDAHFPAFSIHDAVRLQQAWLRAIGIEQLHAVIGYSYGGYQAFQWAVNQQWPSPRTAVLASAPKGRGRPQELQDLKRYASLRHKALPGQTWTHHTQTLAAWREQRARTLQAYGVQVDSSHEQQAIEAWAREFDPLTLAGLRAAALGFERSHSLAQVSTDLLILLCQTDTLFPPEVVDGMRMGDRTTVQHINGSMGHVSPLYEPDLWAEYLAPFLQCYRV